MGRGSKAELSSNGDVRDGRGGEGFMKEVAFEAGKEHGHCWKGRWWEQRLGSGSVQGVSGRMESFQLASVQGLQGSPMGQRGEPGHVTHCG